MDWWRGGVIYQIYPRSFYDSNNDGVGDLEGIRQKLSYLKELGVDGIWVSPFFKSPMKDFGYDVSDYRDIDPVFGNMEDFDKLITEAHSLDLKVIVDQVYSHTSDQHPWFKESRKSKDNDKSDWYIWADARPDGGPPNNWISLFGGQAWSWDSRRQQYYMHNFLTEQPDLNFHNPEVQKEILDIAKFWLEKGVDGFRLDVANFYFHDQKLRDNPPKSEQGGFARPYWHQRHLYDRSQPENLKFMEDIRALTDSYPDKMTVAEIGSDSYIERSSEYCETGRLHTAYNFMLLENGPLTPKLIRDALESWTSDTSWPSWSFSNHDVVRSLTRWGEENATPEFGGMLLNLLLCLKGTIFVYQGEELGLPQAEVPFEKLQDPEGIRFWPDSLGRDGCRTPIPWESDQTNAGFSEIEPWLPVPHSHAELAVSQQSKDPNSTLNAFKALTHIRKNTPELIHGDIEFLNTPDPILAFKREWNESIVMCFFNLSNEQQSTDLPSGTYTQINTPNAGHIELNSLVLPPFSSILLKGV